MSEVYFAVFLCVLKQESRMKIDFDVYFKIGLKNRYFKRFLRENTVKHNYKVQSFFFFHSISLSYKIKLNSSSSIVQLRKISNENNLLTSTNLKHNLNFFNFIFKLYTFFPVSIHFG